MAFLYYKIKTPTLCFDEVGVFALFDRYLSFIMFVVILLVWVYILNHKVRPEVERFISSNRRR
ncbi:MAG TPA: hypothetical protein DHW71_09455 [Gammaproteobacteria bacterium]|nr:hypothetical protein [Gammaproteobacteria bacterium]HCK93202.1 hypothetical protein [Gammaproteobacteria bacterium]